MKSTVSSTGQISIPPALRERLSLVPGTELSIDVHGDTIVLKRMVPGYPDWRTMRGMFAGSDGISLTQALVEERAAELAQEDARINQSR